MRNSLGSILKGHRESQKWSQEDLAQKMNVTRQTVNRWERDQSEPDINSLRQIGLLYSISIDDILSQVESESSEVKFEGASKTLLVIGVILTIVTAVGVVMAHGQGIFNLIAVGSLCILINFVIWFPFSSSIRTGDVSFLAGYDNALDYNLKYLRAILDVERFWFIISGVVASIPFVFFQFAKVPFNFLTAILLITGYIITVIVGFFFISNLYKDKLYANNQDSYILKTSSKSIVFLIAAILLLILSSTLGVVVFGITNNTLPALGYAGLITLNCIVITGCLILELNRPQKAAKQNSKYHMRKVTIALYILSLVLDILTVLVLA